MYQIRLYEILTLDDYGDGVPALLQDALVELGVGTGARGEVRRWNREA